MIYVFEATEFMTLTSDLMQNKNTTTRSLTGLLESLYFYCIAGILQVYAISFVCIYTILQGLLITVLHVVI